jgi:hypothetical protein
MGEKIQLKITPVKVSKDGTKTVESAKAFIAMLNPSEFSHTRAIRYDTKAAQGEVGAETKFSAFDPDTVEFSLLLDSTGAVPLPESQRLDVEKHIEKLNAVVYAYNGTDHEPNHVQLLWGTLILYGRLSSISIQYTLFKPSGDPLRAKVTLKFIGFMSNKEAEAKAKRSSADLSHLVEVRAGDTLPLLCNRIYGDPAYYAQVARFNGLHDVHRLAAGSRLHFPPLV